jgi:CHAT domain-containing protein/Flp pilus assembly protein TadD
MKWVAALLLLTTSCGRRDSPEQLYRNAVLTFRHGELTQALEAARLGTRRSPPDSLPYWRFRMLEAEVLIYRGNSAAAAAILAENTPDQPEFTEIDVRRKMLESYLPAGQRKQERGKLIEEALRKASEIGDGDLLLEVEILQGRHLSAEDPGQARSIFMRARRRAVGLDDTFHQAIALNNLGMISIRGARFDEAIKWFEQALTPAKRAGARPLIAAALNNLAVCYNQLGAFEEAVERRRQAIEWFGPGEVKRVRRDLLAEIGRTYQLQGNSQKAIDYYRQALDIARELHGSDEIRRLTNNLSEALADVGDWDGAAQANSEEKALAENDRAKAYALLNSATIAAGRRRFEQAVSDYQAAIAIAANQPAVLWESYAGLGGAYAQTRKDALAGQHFEKALRVIGENRAGLSRDEYKLTFLARLIKFYQEYVESLMRSGASDKALEVADSSRAYLLSEGLAPRQSGAPAYQTYSRKSGLVLVSYWLAPQQSYAWVISPKGIRPFRLPPAVEISTLIEQYQAFIEKAVRDPMEVENLAGRRLFEALVAPLASLIPRGSQVVLMPDGPLHRLNFETLPVYGENRHYWIEDVTVSIAPSLSILMMSPPARVEAPKSLLLFGGASYSSPAYPPLPHSSVEIENIRRRFATAEKKVFTGAEANPEAYREAGPKRFSMIHFSAHAEANRQSPLDSAIILSPKADRFKLYARDIMETPLGADLVTISACRSAGSRAYAGEGMVGLAWAFLRCGARHAIAGLWEVDDSATAGLMETLYGAMESGKSPVQALRLAKLAMIHSTSAYRKPYYWGPFQIYGR